MTYLITAIICDEFALTATERRFTTEAKQPPEPSYELREQIGSLYDTDGMSVSIESIQILK